MFVLYADGRASKFTDVVYVELLFVLAVLCPISTLVRDACVKDFGWVTPAPSDI